MVKTIVKVLVVLMAAALIFGCAAQKPVTRFNAQDLNPIVHSGEYVQKVDNFLVIIDASKSMAGDKLQKAKDAVSHMNQTIPELRLQAGLRRFGLGNFSAGSPTALLYGMTEYTKPGLSAALEKLKQGNGDSPLDKAIDAAGKDLAATRGKIALIIVSDGADMDNKPITSATKIKEAYGDRICIYTVQVGDDPGGRTILQKVAAAGQCGLAVDADRIAAAEDMADFVEMVFLKKVVKPAPPKPEPPAPAAPPKPMDSDGDGVYDNMDKCPGTPVGAIVDSDGCWALQNVEFDTNKWNIKPQFTAMLDNVATIMKKNPWLKIEIQGHTDSRGTAKYNMGLSEKRAAAVMEYLAGQGIGGNRMMTVGYGLAKPLQSNSTADGMARNRRAEIKIAR